MKRLLLVDQFGHWGGGQVILRDVAEAAVRAGVETHLAAPAGAVPERLTRAGVSFHDLPLPDLTSHRKSTRDVARFALAAAETAIRLHRLARALNPDVVHINGGRVLPSAALSPACRPLTLHAHTAYADGFSRRLAAASLRLARNPVALAPSPFMRRWCIARLGLRPDRVLHIWNWVDDAFFECTSSTADGASPRRLVVLGRVTPLKGQLTALMAFKGLDSSLRERTRLEVIGPVDRRAQGDAYAARVAAEASGQSDITCRLEHAHSRLALEGASVCLVPSQFEETFGLVAAEAMAAGVPVICSAIGALPEVVGDAGVMVPPGNVAALTSVLERLLSDEARCRELSGAGRKRARRLFWRERQVAAVLEALDRHAGQGP